VTGGLRFSLSPSTRPISTPQCKPASCTACAIDLRQGDQATDDVEAEYTLGDFKREWRKKHPSIVQSWRRAWRRAWWKNIPFFAVALSVRKVIYTPNAIESLNQVASRTTKIRGSPPDSQTWKHALPGSGGCCNQADLSGNPKIRKNRTAHPSVG